MISMIPMRPNILLEIAFAGTFTGTFADVFADLHSLEQRMNIADLRLPLLRARAPAREHCSEIGSIDESIEVDVSNAAAIPICKQ